MGKLALFCVAVSTLCSLLTADDIPVDKEFDPTKFSGKWYPILTISYHQPRPDELFTFTSEPSTDGAFIAKVEMPVNGACKISHLNFKPIRPGYFKSDDGRASVHIIEIEYNHHLIIDFKLDDLRLLQLLATKTTAPSEWKEKFNHLAQQLHFTSGEVQDFSLSALCTPPPVEK